MNRNEISRVFLEAAIIMALGAIIGLSLNHRMVLNAFTGKLVAPVARPVASETLLPLPVSLEDVRQELVSGALLVDARIIEVYRDGHIEGALPLPLADIDDYLEDFLREVPRERTLVLYCGGYGCPDSFDLGLRLIEEGYGEVLVFEGGYPEWRDRGLPVSRVQP